MIEVSSKRITLRVGDDEVIFDVDQSIKRPPTEDDECYGIDDLDDKGRSTTEAQELLENEEPDSFLSIGLEKSIDKSDLEGCERVDCKTDNDSDSDEPIRHIASINTPPIRRIHQGRYGVSVPALTKDHKWNEDQYACMTRSLTNELYTPYKDPEREFRSSRRHFKTLSLDELRSPDFNLLSNEDYSKEE
ncbi:hypothetical protein Tco_0499012 [Tanacetum coccineum]